MVYIYVIRRKESERMSNEISCVLVYYYIYNYKEIVLERRWKSWKNFPSCFMGTFGVNNSITWTGRISKRSRAKVWRLNVM